MGKKIIVPNYNHLTAVEAAEKRVNFAFTQEDRVLKQRLAELNKQIKLLKTEQRGVVAAIRQRKLLRNTGSMRRVLLYALKLEGGCYYIGCSYNVDKRYKKHCDGKGAMWTRAHPPLKILEVRETGFFIQEMAAHAEDDMTIEYALKYGGDYVRGGGYCQMKPLWPDVVIQNKESPWTSPRASHLPNPNSVPK